MDRPAATRLLLIEDNPGDARLLREMLNEQGAQATSLQHVDCMHDAEQHLATHAVDLILLDLGLGDAQGLEAVRRAHAAAPRVPVVVLTGLDDESVAAQSLREGAQDYLVKGQIETRGLLRAMRYAIERKGLEETLFQEKERAEVTLNSIADGVICTDTSGGITFVNLVAEKLTGWSWLEAAGRPIADVLRILDAASGEVIPDPMEIAAREDRTVRPSSNRLLSRHDGVEIPIDGAVSPIHDRDGQTTGAVIVFRDVSALRASESRYRGLLEAAPDAMVVVDQRGKIVLLNARAEAQFGYSRDELLGQPVTAIIPEGFAERLVADDLRSAADALSQQIGTGIELAAMRRDGTGFPIEIMLSPLENADGILVTAAIRDISVRKALETQLFLAQKMEAVGHLAAGIAHDFNNLLTAIHGFGELLGRSLPDGDPRRADLSEILRAADRASELTRQLVAFSRRQILRPRVLDPAEVVDGIAPMLRLLIGERITLVTHTQPDLGNVMADLSQLEQVILNLAVNARDAMSEGGKLTIETENVDWDADYAGTHAEVSAGPYVMLAVSDTGEGMDPNTKARAFEPFFTTKEPGKGTGMGLATVYGIVKQSNGSIYLYTEPGLGTTVKVYLPRVDDEATRVAAVVPAHAATTGSETILLVEDNAAVRTFARRVLDAQGYTVLEAACGAEALPLAASQTGPLHLLITDVAMPGMQGHQLAQQLRANRPDLPVLYVSGYTENSVIAQGIREREVSFLPKPFTAEALGRAVRGAIERQRGRSG
jgi:PAS domain S-box-containing protein